MQQQEEAQQETQQEEQLVVGDETLNQVLSGEADEAAAEETAAAVEEEKKEAIRIGGKTFEKQQDAWSYAEELAQERLANDAYRQGLQDAMQTQSPVTNQPEQPEEDDFDERFYSDPKKFLEERERKIAEQIRDQINNEYQEKSRVEQLWNKFYTNYGDLEGKEELVQLTLNQNMDIFGHMKDHDKAMRLLAEKTRGKIKSLVGDLVPKEEMRRTEDPVSSGGSGQTVTKVKTKEEPLDFMSQIANHQKGRL